MSFSTVFIPENEIISGQGYNLITRLSLISQEEIQTKQRHLKSIARKIQWTIPTSSQPLPLATNGDMLSNAFSEDAFGMLLKELDTIKRGDWKGRRTGDKRIQVHQF